MAVTKLAIATVTQGQMVAQTAFSLATAMQFIRVPVQLFLGIGCYIHQNRDTCVRQAMENECSHLLFIDSDVLFNHDAIAKIIAHDLDIVGARYNKRILPVESTVKDEIDKLSEVPFVPAGFLLINMEVFKKIGKPYFSFDEKSDSDDLYFCNKALDSGFKVWCDPTIPVGHMGSAVF